MADRQALARRQEKAGNIAIVNTRLRTELTGYQQQLEELRQTHPDSVMDVSSEVYQTVAKLQRKIKEQEKEIARVNAAEDKRRQNMQNSTSLIPETGCYTGSARSELLSRFGSSIVFVFSVLYRSGPESGPRAILFR